MLCKAGHFSRCKVIALKIKIEASSMISKWNLLFKKIDSMKIDRNIAPQKWLQFYWWTDFYFEKKRVSTFKWTRILKIYIDHFIVDFENVVQKTFKNKCSLKLRRYSLANQKDGFTNKCWVLRDLRFKRHKIMEWFIYVMADALFIDGELKVDKKINSLF